MRHDFDVVVVGAGPAGSYAALLLARRGYHVGLVDRSPEPRRDITCTGIIGTDAFERLELPRSAVAERIPRARFISPSGVSVEYHPRGPLAYVVDRTVFDAALSRRALEAGVVVRYGFLAGEVARTPDGIVLRAPAGGGGRIRARALIVATGHQRRLHASAGLGQPPTLVTGVGADLPFHGLEAAEVYFGRRVSPGFFAWAVPFGDGRARLGVLARDRARERFRDFLLHPAIRSRLALDLSNGGRETAHRATRSRRIVQGAVRPSFAERVLAVGEAAGQIKTTTSGGIFYGLLGAELADRVLGAALADDRLSAARLAEYERLWTRRLSGEIEAGLALQAVGRRLQDTEIDRLFGALNGRPGAALRHLVRFDWHRPVLRSLLGWGGVLSPAGLGTAP